MFGFLKKKNQDVRVLMCIKQADLLLSSYSEKRRARILIMLTMCQLEFRSTGIDIFNLILHPHMFSRKELMTAYESLEDSRNNMIQQLSQTAKMAHQIYGDFPSFAKKHAEDTRTALEIIMATLGGNIVNNQKHNILKIWKFLETTKQQLNEAFSEINQTVEKTSEIIGNEINVFQGMSEDNLVMNAQMTLSLMREDYKEKYACGNPN